MLFTKVAAFSKEQYFPNPKTLFTTIDQSLLCHLGQIKLTMKCVIKVVFKDVFKGVVKVCCKGRILVSEKSEKSDKVSDV